MLVIINIQSFGDIITNSSSETFVIKTRMTEWDFDELFEKILDEHEPGWRTSSWGDYPDDTIKGSVSRTNKGNIRISYPIMCNLGDEAREELEKIFGKQNIQYEYD